jgi:hypothetical protein
MTTQPGRVLQIDVILDARDLFRASLEAARARIVVAILVCALVIAGVVYLFTSIGEGEMLLRLSPLFIGFPLLGVAGQLLRLHAACRKYVKGLSETQRNLHYIFRDGADGFEVIAGSDFAHFGWENVPRVNERPRHFLIYLNKFEGRLLPKRGMSREDVRLLRELLTNGLGANARLLSSEKGT